MKKILSLLSLLFSIIVNCQTVNYNPDTSIFSNPERGLQKYSKNINSSGSYSFVNQTTLTGWRTGTDKVTVIYRYVMLTEFINNNSNISTTYLTNLQTDFDRIRNAGLKVIIRPAYTDQYVTLVQPNKQTILNHISQLSPIINRNKDIIISVQGGFIGVYGEWYYTGGSTNSNTDGSPEFGDTSNINVTQWLNRKDVVDAMLNNFGVIPIQLRYATAKRKMYGSTLITDATAYQNTPLARVGFYNDAFLNEDGDMGTYEVSNCVTPVGTTDYTLISNTSQYLPMNGESNGYNPCNGGLRTMGTNAVVELNQLNFSTLNRDYHPDVWGGWIASGHYNEIVRNLGYRIQLNSTNITVGNTIDFTMNLTNVGYGNIISKKNVYLVFRNTSGTEYKKLLNVDTRFWRTTHTFSQSLVKDMPDGQYSVFLHIADPNLESRPEYSIRLANSNVSFDVKGYNNLNRIVNITTSIVVPPVTTSIILPDCNSTLLDINNTIYCNQVSTASGYRFRVRNGSTLVGTVDRTVNSFSLVNLGITNIVFGTTYTIDVLLAFNGIYGPDTSYGPTCLITTPATISPAVITSPTCGSTISNLWRVIRCGSPTGVQGYKFVVVNGSQTREYITTVPRFQLPLLQGGATANTTYIIRVDVLNNGVYTQGTQTCTIITSINATKINDLIIINSNNTIKNNMNMDIEEVSIYDLTGRKVSNSLDTSTIPNGIYIIQTKINGEIITTKLNIKQ